MERSRGENNKQILCIVGVLGRVLLRDGRIRCVLARCRRTLLRGVMVMVVGVRVERIILGPRVVRMMHATAANWGHIVRAGPLERVSPSHSRNSGGGVGGCERGRGRGRETHGSHVRGSDSRLVLLRLQLA